MKQLEPLTTQEMFDICKKCGGYCCNHFFYRIGKEDAENEFHKFKHRKVMKYGPLKACEFSDPCPHCVGGEKPCDCYEDRPAVCRNFPQKYEPLWNVRCKLMRELYKRGKIPKNIKAFYDIKRMIVAPPRP